MNKYVELTWRERRTLLKAMDLLIDQEQDTICHETLVRKIAAPAKGDLVDLFKKVRKRGN